MPFSPATRQATLPHCRKPLLLAVLAESNIAVEYMYSLFTHDTDNAYMVMRVSDEPRFLAALGDRKIKVMTKDELGLK